MDVTGNNFGEKNSSYVRFQILIEKMITKNTRLIRMLMAIPFILAIPFIAMFITDEVKWNLFDFIVAAGLLFMLALCMEGVLRLISTTIGKWIAGAAVVLIFLLIWAELAVGVVGSSFAGS